ncbi:MAG: transglycosylase SLT domain-containing protein [Nitrospirota bacterium]
MKRFICLLVFLSLCLPVYAEEITGKNYLVRGKNELERGRYNDAVNSLARAEQEFPFLGDYALLWLSEAYHQVGDHKASLDTVRKLFTKYPQSPLKRKALMREIKEAQEISEKGVEQLYRSYLGDYPNDLKISYLYAKWLKQEGKKDEAKRLFKEIYISAGLFSEDAYNELDPSDINVEDMVNRASNFIKKMDYKAAESLLRCAIEKDDGTLKKEILKNLGLFLFRQKRYAEAADIYRSAEERYWEIRSLYRAGKKEIVNSLIDELLQMGDRRATALLFSIAADKRKEGKIRESIDIYQNVMEKYPSEKEEALWGKGWTYFLMEDYKKASEIFGTLYSTSNDAKHLYWYARSLEESGEEAQRLYPLILENRVNFYGILSFKRASSTPDLSLSGATLGPLKRFTKVINVEIAPKKNERVEALLDLGFTDEAMSELIHISKNTDAMDDILYVCSKFCEMKQYEYAVRLASRLPFTDGLHKFLYPLAHRDIIEDIAKTYDIDPLLILSLIREESRFDPGARSVAGALGLMQLMPSTAYRFDRKLKLGINGPDCILDIRNNLHIGISYFSDLIKEFGSYPHAIAAYNAGEDAVKRWLKEGKYKSADEFIEDIPYEETKNYVKKVITTFFEYKRLSSNGEELIDISLENL